MPSSTPPRAASDTTIVKTGRHRKLWWIALALVLVIAIIVLSPIICTLAVAVAITAGVSLGKKTPTFLRFRTPATAARALIISVVVALLSSGMANLVLPRAHTTVDEAPVAFAPASPAADEAVAVGEDQPEYAAPADTVTPEPGTALAALETLEVKGRAPKTGYDRDEFGQRWKDIDHNGCGQRDDVLARDLAGVQKDGRCVVTSGILDDPFTGERVAFERGEDTSSLVQIDHVVPLSDAWQKGAQQLTAHQRETLGNDPLNLLAVDGAANAQKNDSDAATWLPKNTGFRCAYVARQVSVKVAYELWVTYAERDALERILTGCPTERLLTSDYAADAMAIAAEPAAKPSPSIAPAPNPQPTHESKPAPAPAKPAPPADVYYKNCTAAREAGAAPVRRGDPGYAKHLDRDGDGVGCE
ncbi:GmrSD restriction endonuclease domain-containing protein [Microbacterium sp. LMI1x-1-1.1]|uniref:GmrSD restriction endonuclease domain-containing protein n=1 Tax=Microbacterium sp. LMI1x-1-1.1 TaxID=3135246 RepID=UPI00343E059D